MDIERIGIFEAKTHFSEIVDRVAREGRPITVTRRGEPVVDITPIGKQREGRLSLAEAREELARLRQEVAPMSAEEVVALAHEGRKE